MTTKVLLTGGLGYLGGRVAQTLVAAGHDVACGSRRKDASSPAWLPQMRIIPLDWNSSASLIEACSGVDCVIHLAAMNEIESAKDPIAALQMNGVASTMLLQAAINASVPRFIYFSTAHVYGAPLQGSIDEQTLPRPQHPYAITHKVTEDFVLAAHDQKKIEGIVFRLSNAFGAPATPEIDRWTLLVNDLCRQAVTTGQLKLLSAGTQLRDFITLEDVARAVLHVMRLDNRSLADGLFNLGGENSSSIVAMTRLVAGRWRALTGRDIEIIRPEPSGGENTTLNYSGKKLKATGFGLTSKIDEEIDATLRLCLNAFSK